MLLALRAMRFARSWPSRPVLVTGGASFIGSALVEELVARGASVRVIDDLSSGKLENISHFVDSGQVELLHDDLQRAGGAERAVEGSEVVVPLAAGDGGGG